MRAEKKTTSKLIVWACLLNGFAWVWCSYLLAYLGRAEIAESLSQVALTEIVPEGVGHGDGTDQCGVCRLSHRHAGA